MEFVPLSITTFRLLALDDPEIKHISWRCAIRPITRQPVQDHSSGIHCQNGSGRGTGQHWLAIWTNHNVYEVMDSYGLPLTMYSDPSYWRGWTVGVTCCAANRRCKR